MKIINFKTNILRKVKRNSCMQFPIYGKNIQALKYEQETKKINVTLKILCLRNVEHTFNI